MLTSYASPWHSPDLEDFLSTCRRFFEQEVAPWSTRWRKERIVPLADEAVLVEELSRIGVTGFGILPGVFADAKLLSNAATPDQTRRWGPGITPGESIIAIAIAEPTT